jgi:NAD(P)-dependent dehydrogenase (short-subunit alcohol dehydrogenase family)
MLAWKTEGTRMFESKVAIVTGSGGGIGRETALLLAERGAKVIVNDLGGDVSGHGSSSSPADETVALIRAAGGEAQPNYDNVAEWESAQKIVQAALDHYGQIDIVINNAGNVRWSAFPDMPIEDYRSIMSVHMDGTFFVSRAAAPVFRQQESGIFVHTTSTSGIMGHYDQASYCAAKAGIAGLSRGIALDMKKYNVRSNCVAPFAFSRMANGVVRSPEQLAIIEKMKPVQNARLNVALCADEAKDINGQVFICRGNEIFIAGQGFPVKGVHESNEWSPESIAEHGFAALKTGFTPTIGFNEYFTWGIL